MFGKSIWLFFLLFLAVPLQAQRNAVSYRGDDFVSLEALIAPEFMNGEVEMTYWGRNLVIDFDNQRVAFENGGDRLRDADGKVHHLDPLLLVLGSEHFVPIDEAASIFGYTRAQDTLVWKDKELILVFETILADYPFRAISKLAPRHRSIELTRDITAHTMLPPAEAEEALPTGTKLLVRRHFLLGGEPWLIAAINGKENYSVAFPAITLQTHSRDIPTTGTYLARLKERALELAEEEQGFCHGTRDELTGEIALTADLCWSIRSYEEEFYETLFDLDSRESATVYCTQFVSGRWLAQHPMAMSRFLELERSSKVVFIWGLHSWDHPKSGEFMNAYAPESLRGDTLYLEKQMLEWGVVPEHFYRFPGLIHDEARLEEILALDLYSVDCDSWVSGMHTNRPPHRVPATDGSILLVHGNGNEARGITRLYEWLETGPDWRFGPIWRFLDPETDQSALFAEEMEYP